VRPAAGRAGGASVPAVGGEMMHDSIRGLSVRDSAQCLHSAHSAGALSRRRLVGRRAACTRPRNRAPAAPAAHAGASAAAAASPRERCQERPAGRRAAPASAVAAMKVSAGGASTCKD